MAHIVIEIRIRSLSESLLWSFSKDIAATPVIRPREMLGQALVVVFLHMVIAVSHAAACPLLLHSSHMCCSLSSISWEFLFLQNEQFALSAYPGMLFQYDPHFIHPVSMHLMWSLSQGGTLKDLIPFSSFSFVRRRPVTLMDLVFCVFQCGWVSHWCYLLCDSF